MRPMYGRGPDKEAVAQAKEALDAFRGMQLTLTAYAQRLTGRKDVEVVATANSNGSTDGTKIYYRPPTSLGRKLPHESWACDKRDDQGILRCGACRQREEILGTIYHEIAHIWFQSFSGISKGGKRAALEASVNGDLYRDTPFTEGIRERIKAAGDTKKMNYLELSALISPWMQILVNSLEDARIEQALFRALPGTKDMLTANAVQIFMTGVEGRNPRTGAWEKTLWKDRKLNEQAAVALYCKAAGFDYREWFDPWVVSTLDDKDLQPLIEEVRTAKSVEAVFINAFPILALMREKYGYFKSESDPAEPEPPAEEPRDESESTEEGPDGGADPTGDDGGESGDGAREDRGRDETSPEEEGELTDDSDGRDSGESSAGGSSDDLEAADEGPEGEPDSAGDPDGGGGGAGDEVPEEVPDSGNPESTGASGSDGTGDPGDRSGSGEPVDLDGLSGEYSGSKDFGEPSDGEAEPRGPESSGVDEGVEPGDLIDPGAWDDKPSGTMPPKPSIEYGDEWGAEKEIAEATGHHEHSSDGSRDTALHEDDNESVAEAITLVLGQGEWFDELSVGLNTVKVLREGDFDFRGGPRKYYGRESRTGGAGDFRPSEQLIGQAILQARITFQANDRGKHERGLKRGRVHGGSLASKAPFGDPRMFERKTLPGRNSYFVGLGLDISGSTSGVNLDLIKRIAFAEAEMLSRLGVNFFMYAHSGTSRGGKYDLTMHELKAPDEPWNDKTRVRLDGLGASEANLDGHTMEFYRKILDTRREKTRILHYYTDGAMPCENGPEEREVLKREIRTFRQKNYVLVGVGVRTTAPKAYGLDTVEVNEPEDIKKVIVDLRARLEAR